MRRLPSTLLWAAAAIAPLVAVALLILFGEASERRRVEASEGRQLASEVSALLEMTVGVASRQLRSVAEVPGLSRAIRERDRRAIGDELAYFTANEAWLGVAVVEPGGKLLYLTGTIDAELARPPYEARLAFFPGTNLQPARAQIVAPITDGQATAWLVGDYSLAELLPLMGESAEAGGHALLVIDSRGTVILGPVGTVGRLVELLEPTENWSRLRIGQQVVQAQTESALGGLVGVMVLRPEARLLRRSLPVLAGLVLSALILVFLVTAWRRRLNASEKRLEVRERELVALHELAIDATISMRREHVVHAASASAATLVDGVSAAVVALGSPGDVTLDLLPSWPEPSMTPHQIPLTRLPILSRAFTNGRRELGSTADALHEIPAVRDCQWVCWTPLVAHGRILGALGLFARRPRQPPSPEEARVVDALAATLAVALESQERMGEVLRQQDLLATVVDASPDGLLALDESDRVILDNHAARRMFRFDRSMTGLKIDELMRMVERRGGVLDFDFEVADLLGRARAGEMTRGGLQLRFGDHALTMESVMAPIALPQGVHGILVAMRDVSERRELEDVRRLNVRVSSLARQTAGRAALLEQVLAAADVGLAFFDRQDRITYANDRFYWLLEVPPLPRESEDDLLARIAENLDRPLGELPDEALLITRAPERRMLAVRTDEVRDADDRPIGRLVSLRDETAHRELEAAREAFIGVAAHELKNPVAALRLRAELGLRDPSKSRDALKRIHDRTIQLQDLVERLLDVTRAELGRLALEPRAVDLVPLTRESCEPFLAQGAQLELELPDSLLIRADPVRLKQVIENLLSNAVRYAEPPFRVRVERVGGEACIAVTDRGPGIPRSEQETIFDRFAQGARGKAGPGLGVGLYLARRIVEAHGGRIELKSRVGEGSTFLVQLPIEGPPSE